MRKFGIPLNTDGRSPLLLLVSGKLLKKKLLGSKTLGTNVLTSICIMLANHDQNIESRFRLAQSMFICKIGIE